MLEQAALSVDEIHALAPDEFLVVDLAGAELLAGPTGAFLVVVGTDAPTLERLATRVEQVRALMSEHLQWVPFIHPVVLSDIPRLVPRAMTLTGDELQRRMAEGRPCIEPETLDKIRQMVERRILHSSELQTRVAGHR